MSDSKDICPGGKHCQKEIYAAINRSKEGYLKWPMLSFIFISICIIFSVAIFQIVDPKVQSNSNDIKSMTKIIERVVTIQGMVVKEIETINKVRSERNIKEERRHLEQMKVLEEIKKELNKK